jgi:hypothetical protein
MRHTVVQRDLHACRFRRISRQRIAHLNRRQFFGALLQYVGHILTRMLSPCEVEREIGRKQWISRARVYKPGRLNACAADGGSAAFSLILD